MEKLFAKFFNSEHILDTLKDKADKIEITKLKSSTADKN